jgi:hypothetical protein
MTARELEKKALDNDKDGEGWMRGGVALASTPSRNPPPSPTTEK